MKSLFCVLVVVVFAGCYQAPREPVYVQPAAPAPAPQSTNPIIVQPPVIVNPPHHCPPGQRYCPPHARPVRPNFNINIVPGGGHHHHHHRHHH